MPLKSRIAPLVETTLDLGLRPRGRRRFQEACDEAGRAGSLKVNLGSGGHPLDGWLNCDVTWRAGCYLDATSTWPVAMGSVELVYADNVIEHLTLEQGRLLLRHAREAMAPGGMIRLATPDVEAVARQYLERGELARLGMERNRERGRDFRYPVQLLTQVYVGAKHYLGFVYDYEALSSEMIDAGFAVVRVDAGESEHHELRGLESRLHPAEAATQLIVEGTKPS